MGTDRDRRLARLVVARGLLSKEEVRRGMAFQRALRERGKTVGLESVLVKRFGLDRERLRPSSTEATRGLSSCESSTGSGSGSGRSVPAGKTEDPTRSAAGDLLDRYELGQKLGEGGMATVYQALDRQLGRQVAIKILKGGGSAEATRRKRLLREARSVARLGHPNIIGVHDVGESDGQAYLVMELVEGMPLDKALKGRSFTLTTVLRLMVKVARAVDHAHEQGIVHRDLKPSNILVGADGEPKICDFGLARLTDSQSALTRSGAVLGTPYCMAPEQVNSDHDAIGPRTDVYALGVLLYQLLTGRRPFHARTPMTLYQKILHEEPKPPRQIKPTVHPDLEAIALKAMEKDPARRYPTAAALAADLEGHLEGRGVEAKALSFLGRVERVGRRRWRGLFVAAAGLVVSIGVGTLAYQQAVVKPAVVESALDDAARAHRAGDLDRARAAYQLVLGIDGDHPEAAAGLDRIEREMAVAARRQGEVDERAVEAGDNRSRALALLEQGRGALDDAFRYLYDRGASHEELVRRVDLGQDRFKEALALDPDLPLAQYLMGRSWAIKGWGDLAETYFRKAISLDPNFAPAHYELGRLLQARAFLISTISTTESVERKFKVGKELAEEAARELERAMSGPAGFDDPVQRELVRSLLYYLEGHSEDARRVVVAAIDEHGSREGVEELWWLRGLVDEDQRRIQAFDRAISLRPKYPLALLCRGILHERAGRYEESMADYSEAIRIHPRFPIAYLARAATLMSRSEYDRAEVDLSEAIRIQPDFSDAYLNRGLIRYRHEDLEGALQDLDHSIRLRPESPVGFLNRGVVKRDLGDIRGALDDYGEAIRIEPDWGAAYHNRGICREVDGNVTGAYEDYTKAIEFRVQGKAESYYTRGYLLATQGQMEAAVDDFEAALALRPAYPDALVGRGMARQSVGDVGGAVADYDDAIRIDPSHVDARFYRANVHMEKREFPAAIASFDAVLAADPEFWDAYVNRGVAKYASGDLDGTIADFEKALAGAPPTWENRSMAEALLLQAREAKLQDS